MNSNLETIGRLPIKRKHTERPIHQLLTALNIMKFVISIAILVLFVGLAGKPHPKPDPIAEAHLPGITVTAYAEALPPPTKQKSVKPTTPPAKAPETAPAAATQPTPTPPTCPDTQWIWADDGQCHDKPVQAAPVAQAAPAAPASYGSHQDMLAAAGIAQGDWAAADYIVMHEGHYCPTIWNGEVGCPGYHGTNAYKAYGVCQALSPDKMATAGADWETNPITQLRWCASYAASRYGGWWNAYYHWQSAGNW